MSEPKDEDLIQPSPTDVPRCIHCRYDVRGLLVDDRCPECGEPVWPDVERISKGFAKQYARVETSFYAACLAVVMSLACGPFGILIAVWAVIQSIAAVRQRNAGVINLASRNMPFVSLAVSSLAALISVVAMLTRFGVFNF